MNGMTDRKPIADRLKELNIELPPPAAAVANYVPFVISGTNLYISGQLPMHGLSLAVQGTVGGSIGIREAHKGARLCVLNILAQAQVALDGNLDRIRQVIRLGGFVSSTADFYDQPQVINGASDLMVEIFGEIGRHSRTAVGVASLPRGAAVEIEALFEID